MELPPDRFVVNNHILAFAFRYALGRTSTSVGIVVDQLKEHWPRLNKFDRNQIRKEIMQAIKMGEAGHQCDIDNWSEILRLETGRPPWQA